MMQLFSSAGVADACIGTEGGAEAEEKNQHHDECENLCIWEKYMISFNLISSLAYTSYCISVYLYSTAST